MKLYERNLEYIKEAKRKVEEGGVNGIPIKFKRFRSEFPCIEQKNYYQVTANTKVGKTQLTDELFMYAPVLYAMNNQDKIRLKIFYFTLEIKYAI